MSDYETGPDGTRRMRLRDVKLRTGLTRKQLRYLEERGLIGPVLRSDDRRVFTEKQVSMLEVISRLRELGARLDEAAALAAEALGDTSIVTGDRVADLLARALDETQRRARAAYVLAGIVRRRQGIAA